MKKNRVLPIQRRNNRIGWIFIAAASLLLLLFNLYPILAAFRLAFMSGTGSNMTFVGLENYSRVFGDETFRKALFNTVLYLVVQVPIMLFLGLVVSSILQNPKIRFKGFFRTALFLPCITSSIAYSLTLKTIFANEGVFNTFLSQIGLIHEPILWLNDPVWSKVLIIIVITWRWTGYNAIFYIAGLQNIDPEIYEAARLDGANGFQTLIRISVPILKPIILFTSITSTVGTLQLFDEVQNITLGGPGNATMTISQYVYNICFKYVPDFGYASAICIFVAILIAVLSMIQMKVTGED